MSASARTSADANDALVAAIRKHQFDKVKNILENDLVKINGNRGWESPLCVACKAAATTDATIVALLLEYGADPNYGSSICIEWSIRHATNDALSHLLRFSADPNAISLVSGASVLHFVCRFAHYDKIELLLQHGANPNQLDNWGESPVFQMFQFERSFNNRNHLSCLRLMLEYGADPNVISRCGATPLFLVMGLPRRKYRLRAIQLLMQHGADVNIPLSIRPPSRWKYAAIARGFCIKGDTILHAVVRLCDVAAIRVITECQAITTFLWQRNENGDTVYDVASKSMAAPIIEYFDMKWQQWRQECYAHLRIDWSAMLQHN